jgi:hypothetical protein
MVSLPNLKTSRYAANDPPPKAVIEIGKSFRPSYSCFQDITNLSIVPESDAPFDSLT